MFRTAGWCLAAAVLVAGCSLPTKLSEDGYDAAKYNLPVVVHAGASKTVTVSNGAAWAFTPAVKGTYYELSADQGGTVSVYHADKATAYATTASGTSGRGFIATASENVFIKITSSGSAPASYTVSCASYSVLTSGVWQNGTIADDADGNAIPCWYAFPVTAGTSYDFSMNNAYDGDNSRTAYTYASEYGTDRATAVVNFGQADYASPGAFVPSATGVVFIKVFASYYEKGTFAVRVQPTQTTALSTGAWQNGTIAYGQMVWYSYPVTAGQLYDFNMHDRDAGDGLETADTTASVYHSDHSTAYVSNADSVYAIAATFMATATETVYIKVSGTYQAGTFAVRMQPTTVTALSSTVWQTGTFASSGVAWYSFSAAGSTSYTFHMNNAYQGNNTMTGYTQATIYHSDLQGYYGSQISTAYTSGYSFTPSAGPVFICVSLYSSAGTFAVEYQ